MTRHGDIHKLQKSLRRLLNIKNTTRSYIKQLLIIMDPNPPEECTICLEDLDHTTKIGLIRACHHYYHESCIIQWSNNSNSCPTCRKLFNTIDVTYLNSNSVIRSVTVQDKLLPNAAIDDIPTEFIIPANAPRIAEPTEIRNGVCSICSSSDYRVSLTRSMMTCQSCNATFHQSCLGISNMYDDEDMGSSWFCPICDFQQDLILPPSSARRRQTASIMHSISNRRPRTNVRTGRNVIRNIVTNQNLRRQRRNEMELVELYGMDEEVDPPEQPEVYNFSDEDMDLESNDDGAPDDYYIPPPVLNGGIIARNELRQRATLSEEELKSWDLFDRAKEGDSEVDINSNNNTGTSRRRRRKRTTHLEMPDHSLGDNNLNTHVSSSKVLMIISQMRLNNQQTASSSIGSFTHYPKDAQVGSSSSSMYTASPTGGSPASMNSNFSPVTSAEEDSKRFSDSSLDKKNELTFDQKSKIQTFIRDKLRPLYKRRLSKDVKLIKSEEDYIRINKSASRKIYGSIAAKAKENDAVLDRLFNHSNDELLLIVEEYVNNEIHEYCK